jgi:excinuclease UvrABC ATPase subunit
MVQDQPMEIVGARTNNLQNINVSIPKNRIVVFTGVSGSGKSSLVFDTIAAESQRQLNETYSTFIRHRLPHYGQPDADRLANLPVAILVDQKRLAGNARSTVGTATDFSALLRLLFSRIGQPFVGETTVFSFNNLEGMCPACEGLGRVDDIDLDALIDRSRTMNEGPFRFPGWKVGSYRWKRYALTGFFDNDKPIEKYTDAEWRLLVEDSGTPVTRPLPGWYENTIYEGVLPRFRRTYLSRDRDALREAEREALQRVTAPKPCPSCQGGRLKPDVLACKIKGRNIADCAEMEPDELIAFLRTIDAPETESVVATLIDRLQAMIGLGLDYISLGRETPTLSGGESQRIKMVRHLGSSLSNIAYIFDEPSSGLHPRDVHQVTELLTRLRDKGNSVLIVEHDPDVIAVADYIVDIGPGAGPDGGRIVFEGTLQELRRSSTKTAKAFSKPRSLREAPRKASNWLKVRGATLHNLKNVDVYIPLGILTVVAGVAGSGKSTLTKSVLARRHPEIVCIDQSALGGSRRSTPATYIGIHDRIRALFAAASGKSAGLFSSNSAGACSVCRGLGVIRTDLAFMDAVEAPCKRCEGTGYSDQALAIKVAGRTIADVAAMSALEAQEVFENEPTIAAPLKRMEQVGLGYLSLGQQLNTLSGGERQRLRLADELGRESAIYLLDEPTSGLHMADVDNLLDLFDRLIGDGKSLLVVEHNLEVMAKADWIIEMGPGAGRRGGRVIFEGVPQDMLVSKESVTRPFLDRYLKG